jgi:hypothetical protein
MNDEKGNKKQAADSDEESEGENNDSDDSAW